MDSEFSNQNFSKLKGYSRNNFFIALEKKVSYEEFKNRYINAICNLKTKDVNEYQKVLIIDKITNYVAENFGNSNQEKIIISQEDTIREAFYGLKRIAFFYFAF